MIRKVMDAIYPSVGGLDVHEETVVACRRRLIFEGQAESEVETFCAKVVTAVFADYPSRL